MKHLLIFIVACAGACGGKTDKASDKASKVELVAECVQYQAALDSCFHRDSGFASQPAMIPRTEADRRRLQQVCSENLARLKTACP